MQNRFIAAVLREYAELLDLSGEDRFRVSAYRRASDTVRGAAEPLEEIAARHQLQRLPGIGQAISAEIEEVIATGHITRLDALRAAMPPVVIALMRVPGIGPKTAMQLHAQLHLPDLAAYEEAIRAGALSGVKGIGARREAEILSGLRARIADDGRILLGAGIGLAARLLADFASQAPAVSVTPIGSLRRWAPTLGDIDLLAATDDADTALDAFAALPDVLETIRRDPDAVRVRLIDGADAEMIVRPVATAGGALLWLTGSKATANEPGFRDTLAAFAAARGFTLDGAGLRHGDRSVEGDEEAAFAALGLPFIPPELREGADALDRVRRFGVPRLVELADILGDLHTHTEWSDGGAPVAAMAAAAHDRGYAYYGIADHSRSLKIANGLDAERLRTQRQEIERTAAGIRLLCGSEVEVHSDGTLDFNDAVLARLDYAIASVHSGQRGDAAVVTSRTLAAIDNPYIDIIAHPTGRMPLHRAPMDLDFDAVFAAAARTETALEINADYHRLDLDASLARRAADAGVVLTINSDAHNPDGLGNMIFGVMTARRAWLTPEQILNCWPAERILERRARRIPKCGAR